MLKRKLIAIAIVTLGLGIISAFGQAADWEIKPMVKKPQTVRKSTIRKPTSVKERTETVNNNEYRSKKPQSIGKGTIKKPTGLATGKRQHKPLKGNVSVSRTRKPVLRSTNQKIVKKPAGWSFGESQYGTQVRRIKKP